jgi:hypothetical protein
VINLSVRLGRGIDSPGIALGGFLTNGVLVIGNEHHFCTVGKLQGVAVDRLHGYVGKKSMP